MNAERLEDPSKRELLTPARLVSTFWGLAAVVLLCVYSLLQTLDQAPVVVTAPSRPAPAASPELRTPAFASFVPPDSYPEVAREPPILNLVCGADDVRSGGAPGAGRYPITMRFDQVPNDIRAVLDGIDTVFPKDARINISPCIRGMLDRGELP